MSNRTDNTLQGSLLLSRVRIRAFLGATLVGFCASRGLAVPSLPTNEVSARSLDHSVVISGNQISNRISIDQSTTASQVGSVGLNQGMVIAPLGTNFVFNFYGTLPSTVTKEAFEALEKKLSNATNTIELTRADVRLLARALRDLDERTSGIEKLPDGRTMLGGVVAGTPTVVVEAFNAGQHCYTNGDFAGALEHFTNAVAAMESAEVKTGKSYIGLGGRMEPKDKALLFSRVAHSAQEFGKEALANEFAKKAVQMSPSAQNQALLASTLHNLALECLARGDLASALENSTNAITHWFASAKASPTNSLSLSSNDVAKMYGLSAAALFSIGMQSFGKGDLRSALDMFTNAANVLVESQKSSSEQGGVPSTNFVAKVLSYAAETSEKLGNTAQAYEFSRRAFETDGSAFHQAQMAHTLLSLGRTDEARAAIESAFQKDPKDLQIVGLRKQITAVP
jgi:tetratricopeptide (TPR) repeat protein